MNHVVLLGDSIFDNGRYVPDGPCVHEHLLSELPKDWHATLLARDGAVTHEVAEQAGGLPKDTSHIVISSGGNDALMHSHLVRNGSADSFAQVLTDLAHIVKGFQKNYREMLLDIRTYGKPVLVCTIYDSVPGLGPAEKAGLSLFNEMILREAIRARVPVLDLRLLCDEASDFSTVSPIEPSVSGGSKIARAIARVATEYPFPRNECRIFI